MTTLVRASSVKGDESIRPYLVHWSRGAGGAGGEELPQCPVQLWHTHRVLVCIIHWTGTGSSLLARVLSNSMKCLNYSQIWAVVESFLQVKQLFTMNRAVCDANNFSHHPRLSRPTTTAAHQVDNNSQRERERTRDTERVREREKEMDGL